MELLFKKHLNCFIKEDKTKKIFLSIFKFDKPYDYQDAYLTQCHDIIIYQLPHGTRLRLFEE